MHLANLSFIQNKAAQDGGAIYFEQQLRFAIFDSHFEGNSAENGDGGSIFSFLTPPFKEFLMKNVTCISSTTKMMGGCISFNDNW